jgi:N-methylhydantoinase A
MKLRVGIDVGGTFTDVTAFDEDRGELVAVRKYLSDPAEPAAVMETITADLARDFGADSVALILHGSTAALNTLLEGRGVKVGLLTTRGFRDVYEIGRQWRGENVFNLFAPAPRMLLTRERIFEIGERLSARGEVVEPLAAEDVADAARKLVAAGVEAVALCFLFAYANPAHEQAAAEIIRAIAPGLYLSLSHEVNPEWREYERTASTVANAYIGPPVARYLGGIEQLSLRRFPRSRALMMKSDGGAASARMLARTPIQTVMSGPVAGVIGGRHLGDVKGIDNLITFDTGGTSSDMAVLPGAPLFKSEVTVARHPLRTHTVDIETIGAGGGSIAAVQLGGVLKVGPQSAGAKPGPACYARGGSEPTLTDALVVLGHLNPTALLEGAMPIDGAKARAAVMARVAEPLGLSPTEAAWGILRVLATNVVVAMRTITVERGYDPREFTLVPFGGMGPTIAGMVAAELGIGRILIPRDPGTFSARHAGDRRAPGAQPHPHHAARRRIPRRARGHLCQDGRGGARRPLARAVPARAPADASPRRHALSRPVLRSRGAGREPARRARHGRVDRAVPRRPPPPLRPYGASRSGRDRQFPGDRGRPDP